MIQAVLMYASDEYQITGDMPYKLKDHLSNEYWEFCDRVIDLANDLDLYFALLPNWGSFVKNNVLTVDSTKEYATFLGKRYQDGKNNIWVLGGDARGDINPEIHDVFGKVFKQYNPNRLVTFHPFGRTASYLWFQEKPWLDFNMFQSGHRRYDQLDLKTWDDNDLREDTYGEDCWKYVQKNSTFKNHKPIIDAEPSYEGIVQGLHDIKEPYWEAKDVRRYAYWGVFEGAVGFTYGNNTIIQFYKSDDPHGSYGVREPWTEGLHSEGGAQMQYLKNLMMSVDFTHGKQRNDLLISGQNEKYHRISVFAGEKFIFVYDYMGDRFELSLKDYKDKKMCAYWMNPQNDSMSFIDCLRGLDSKDFIPTQRHENSNDCVLILKEENI